MSTSVASVTSHFPDAENGFSTTTSGSVASGATTVGLNSTGGYTNGEPVVLVIDPTDATLKQAFTGIVDTSGVQVTGVKWTAGTNTSHAAGATVVDYPTATHIAMISKGIKVEHNQDGTHAAVTATSVSTDTISEDTVGSGVTIDGLNIKDSALNTNNSVVTANITDENVTSRKLGPTVILESATSNTTINSGSDTDVTGCTTTFTPAIASVALVIGIFAWDNPSTSGTEFQGLLDVDGSNEAAGSDFSVVSGLTGMTTAQTWLVSLTAASHTLKLQAKRTTGSGSNSAVLLQDSTRLIVLVLGDAGATVS